MCGLFGWTLKNKVPRHARMRAFRVLASRNDFRGGDSYGAFLADERVIYRGLGKMASAKWPKKEPRPMYGNRLLCHTRFATHGTVTRQNAHPFTIGTITGAHNGVIFNHESLNRAFNRDYAVDSQHIFAHLNEGLDLADLQGYGTITFESKDDPGVIYLGTFGGDISVARLTHGRGIVWSSDDKHLKDAMKAAGWTYQLIDIKDGKLYCIHDCEIYTTDRTLDVRQQYMSTYPSGWSFRGRHRDPDLYDEDDWKSSWWRRYMEEDDSNDTNDKKGADKASESSSAGDDTQPVGPRWQPTSDCIVTPDDPEDPSNHDCDLTCGTGSALDNCPFLDHMGIKAGS